MLSFRTRGNFVDFVHTDNTSLEVESVIMSLHNTSKAVDWSLPEDTTRINFTIDDISYDNILITDIDFDGVTMTAQADFKTNIETIFPGLAGGGGGVGYLTYVAMLTQSGTDAPVATVLANTLGGAIVWTRLGVGWYAGTLTGAFTLNKTWIPGSDGSRVAMYPISFNAINDYAYTLYQAGVNSIELQIFDDTYQNVEFSTVFVANALALPEVRVYP